MEKIEFEDKLFDAIKKDDLKSFSLLMVSNSDLNICYGRFPILSLLYLYSSYKILSKYEKLLMPIHNYKIVEEKFEMYTNFKRYAKKTIRFFSNNNIVYPILMLAVLDERSMLENNYKFLFKNEEIDEILAKIYKINLNLNIKTENKNIIISNKINSFQKMLFTFAVILCTLIIAFSGGLLLFVKNNTGFGTVSNPTKIATESALVSALNSGKKHYSLTKDIKIKSFDKIKNTTFSGTLYGNGHKLVISSAQTSSLIKNLTGTIDGLCIILEFNELEITQNWSVLVENNSGNIKNCSISGSIDLTFNVTEKTFASLFVCENSGTISGCISELEIKTTNINQSDAYFSIFAGENGETGKIENSITKSGSIIADTVDTAGIASQNYGEINNCENHISISQTSNKEWHPNVAGIAVSNYNLIESCKNYGKLSASSIVEGDEDYRVFVGGIVCDNNSQIISSRNYGDIFGSGKVSNVIAGGIASFNVYTNGSSYGIIQKSLSKSDIKVFSEIGQVCVGGVAGINGGSVFNTGFIGTIDANSTANSDKQIFINKIEKPATVFAGGIVGLSQNSLIRYSYADVAFVKHNENGSSSEENGSGETGESETNVETIKFYAGLIGNVGVFKYTIGESTNENLNASSFNYISNNYYVKKSSVNGFAYGIFANFDSGRNYISGQSEMLKDSYTFVGGTIALAQKIGSLEEISEEVLLDE